MEALQTSQHVESLNALAFLLLLPPWASAQRDDMHKTHLDGCKKVTSHQLEIRSDLETGWEQN